MMDETEKRSDFEEILAVILIFISCFFVFTYFLTIVFGPIAFFFTPEGIETSAKLLSGLPVYLFVVHLFYIPIMPTVGIVFLFLVSIFFLCLLAAWRFRESFHTTIRKGSSRSIGKLFNNFLVIMPLVTSMLFVAVWAITILQDFVGFPTEPPQGTSNQTPFELFFVASYASVVEEIGFRLSPIGLFLIIRVFEARFRSGIVLSGWQRLKLLFTALVYPEDAKRAVGLKTVSDFGIRGGLSRGEWVIIFLTAFPFGLAHFLGGWTIAKFTPAFITGLFIGLVYIAYGAYAPILLHWFFNYYNDFLFNISLDYYPYLLPISGLAALLILTVGIGGLIVFAIIGTKKLSKKLKTKPLTSPLPLDQSSTMVENNTT